MIGSRYCLADQIHNTIGYPGGRSWSPRSQYSCVGAAQSQSAGFLVATSDRASSSGNDLYLRVRNQSGGTRNLGIFGPSLQDIGCGYQNLTHQATRTYYISLARGAYTHLNWYAWQGGVLSWGYLDFE